MLLAVSTLTVPSIAADGARDLTITTKDGKVHAFKVELALTPQQQAYGLMNRTSLPENAGMLFFWAEEREQSFWMKNTLIPLDLIFIRKDGTIHHIHHNAKPHDLTALPSKGPVSAVLEVNGGTAERLKIAKGDKIHHLLFVTR